MVVLLAARLGLHMSEVLGAVWEFILRRLDSAYLLVASLLAFATICGDAILRADVTNFSLNSGGLSPTLYAFSVVSEFLTGGDQWSWIQATSRWLTERSEVLRSVAGFLLLVMGCVVGWQGSESLRSKASATLFLMWVLVVNTGGMTIGNWLPLIVAFLVASLARQDRNGSHVSEMLAAFVGVILFPAYFLLFVYFWVIGKTRSQSDST